MSPGSTGGCYVVLVGPDGAGKTTVAGEVSRRLEGQVVHRHWRPGVLPMAREPTDRTVVERLTRDPHSRGADRPIKSMLRTLYYFADFVLGYLLRVLPSQRRGEIYLLERGFADMVIDPKRYGLSTPRFTAALLRLLPPADVAVLLDGDPEEIGSRKPELTTAEIARQLDRWQRLEHGHKRMIVIDTRKGVDAAASQVTQALRAR